MYRSSSSAALRRASARAAVLVSALVLAAPAAAELVFTHASQSAGIGTHKQGGTTLHNLGVAWTDIDNDLCPDLFVPNGFGFEAHLYRNDDCDGTFTLRQDLLPALPDEEMSGAVFADYDNDGDQDIYVFVSNEQFDLFGVNDPSGPPNHLLQNQFVENGHQILDGQPLFVDVAPAAGVDDLAAAPLGVYPGHRSMTGGWLDYDRDGCVDLYVGQMVLQAATDPANSDRLYRNLCDGTFADVTAESNVNRGVDPDRNRPALAFIGAHLDTDLWADMYVVNVHEAAPHCEDLLFQNHRDGRFAELADADADVGDDAGSGMGIDVADIDNDGRWDIYISDVFFTTNDELPLGNPFYHGLGAGARFEDNDAPDRGIDADFSWAVNFFDGDNDGWEDLWVGTISGGPFLYANDHDGTFTDVSAGAGFLDRNFRGAATADYDRDGDVDLVAVHYDGALDLYRNDSSNPGNQWLEVKLIGTASNRDAINAVVRARAPGGLRMLRQVKGGSSAHSQDDLVVHFGFGTAPWINIEVRWPSGAVERYGNLAPNQLITITEGTGITP